ncbi:hypothetical protein E4U14_003314 [Claviceps sp. LM454 group G7]|nr:hypothetical protein E4U14_003314 [Claviceps sp. LM454 group G7]
MHLELHTRLLKANFLTANALALIAINATVLIAAAVAVVVAVRAVHIAGISHGQHYVTDSPLDVYLRRTLSRASALHSKTSLAAVGFMPPPSAGTTRSSTTRSKSQSIAPAAHAARALSRTNADGECMEQRLTGVNNRSPNLDSL